MRQREILAYAKKACPDALRTVQTGGYATALPELTIAEKAVLYHYTEDGYAALNAHLHTHPGPDLPALGQALVPTLRKLPPYTGLVYSGAWLRSSELQFYRACALAGQPVHWPAFLSTSRHPGMALQFLRGMQKNCLFVIHSKTGRLIEAIAKWGIHGQAPGQNEAEVLFPPHTAFDVLAVVTEPDYTRITLNEL